MTADYAYLGPLMVDIEGLELTEKDRQRLCHPCVGGVILFARNFSDRKQLSSLISEIRALRSPNLLIAVDQEGGRVQRFKQGFTALPAAATFGELWDRDKQTAPMRAFESAVTMASELLEVGVDLSFAPVFDVCAVPSDVIGDRAFHRDPKIATELIGAYIDGMHTAGMAAVAKHFPGHGGVSADSHHCLPEDDRGLPELLVHDLIPYRELINEYDGVMTAHIRFPKCDARISSFSRYWINDVLRGELGFSGIVFSDDLSMQGAVDAIDTSGDSADRLLEKVTAAIAAGCDMPLVCNDSITVDAMLANDNVAKAVDLHNWQSYLQRKLLPLTKRC